MILLLALMVQLADGLAVGQPGSFPSASKGIRSTAIELSGQDTSDARIVGRVTHADAREYCRAWNLDETPAALRRCMTGVQGDIGKQEVATADCVRGTMTSYGERVRLERGYRVQTRLGEYNEAVWRSLSEGNLLEDTMASGDATMTAQFAVLCPRTVRGWPVEIAR